MTHEQLQREIVSCIWSEGLKRRIESTGRVFTEEELLWIAFHCPTGFDERLRLLQLLADHAPSVADRAAGCRRRQLAYLLHFRQSDEQEVYELRIKSEPEAYEERYLCESFEDALEMIDLFYNAYYEQFDDTPVTEQARYVIEKRKVHQPGQPFSEDSLGECVLGPGKELLFVELPFDQTDERDCEDPWIYDFEVSFSTLVPDRSVVQYRLSDGTLHYGVNLTSNIEELTQAHYIIPLDGENGRIFELKAVDTFWDYHHDHEHVPAPFVEEISVDELPAHLQENYRTFLACLDALQEKQETPKKPCEPKKPKGKKIYTALAIVCLVFALFWNSLSWLCYGRLGAEMAIYTAIISMFGYVAFCLSELMLLLAGIVPKPLRVLIYFQWCVSAGAILLAGVNLIFG